MTVASPIHVVHYDIVFDAIVIKRMDGSEDRHACGGTPSDAKLAEVCARVLEEQPVGLTRTAFGLKAI